MRSLTEKAFDRVNMTILYDMMCKRDYPKHIIDVIKSLCYYTRIVLSIEEDLTEEIYINQEVRQGCSISPTLFNIWA